MFHSSTHILRRTPKGSSSRPAYLQQLVTEFQTSDHQTSKEEILANLANFAYDPYNYEFLRELNVVDLFLDMMTEENERLVEFGIGGLCNLVVDKESRDYILESDGIIIVKQCLSSSNVETVMSAITTLIGLVTPASKQEITSTDVVKCMQDYARSDNKRLSNLAQIFLEDLCKDIRMPVHPQNIPLPPDKPS